MRDRDIVVLKRIIQYSDEIEGTIASLELTFNKFIDDYIAKNAIAMCILQIGEITGKLTDEFKLKYNNMPWRDIISVRNKVAHAYESFDLEILWGLATNQIPELKAYCEKILIKEGTNL